MAWWRRASCPVQPVEQDWIERSMTWLLSEFGERVLHGEVVLPTDEYFPGTYRGTERDVRGVLDRLCERMEIDPGRVRLEYGDGGPNPDLSAHVPLHSQSNGHAGLHEAHHGSSVLTLSNDVLDHPMALVATLSHELGHVLLLGEQRIAADQPDHEPLTDLLTVFFGLGIFAANAAFDYSRDVYGQYSYTRSSRLGYLNERMYGYALALYASQRGETDPPWARYLDTNPRAFLRQGLRYLAEAGRRDAARSI
jgi:hypothetical protein